MVRDFLMVKIKINKQNCVINDEHDLEKKIQWFKYNI